MEIISEQDKLIARKLDEAVKNLDSCMQDARNVGLEFTIIYGEEQYPTLDIEIFERTNGFRLKLINIMRTKREKIIL